MLRNIGFRTAAVLVLAWVLGPASTAQVATGRLQGIVQDQSGAAVPNAAVAVANVRTQTTLRTVSDVNGFYIFASLPPSFYNLTVEAQGFSKTVLTNLEINAAVTVTQNVKLELGTLSEVVSVEADAVRVQTSDAQIGRTVTLQDIATLPQLGRGPLALAIFAPGISVDPANTSFARVNGLRQGANNVRLDGIDANDAVVPRFGLSLTAVNVDSVEEMRVITNGFKAEYGRNAGGQIEMISRSGTNNWHGNAFDFLRNTRLNANRFFSNSSGVGRPKFIQNIFGGSLGGPIRRERTFIFGNYQGRRTAQETSRNRLVFTPQAKAGVFRWRAPGSADIQSFDMFRNDPRGRGLDPNVRQALSIMPDPNNVDIGDTLNTAGFRFNNPSGSFEDQFTIKADHNLWSGHRVFYRHSWQRNEAIDALNNADARYPGRPQGRQGGRRWGYSIGSDWTIRPTLINEARLGYQSASVDFLRPDRPKGPGLDFTSVDDPILLTFAQGRNSPVKDFTDNVSWVRGKSTWKFGFNTRQVLQYGWNEAGIYPNIAMTRNFGNVPSGVGPTGTVISAADRQRFEEIYNDLLGRVSSISQTFYSDLQKFQAAGTPRVRNFHFGDYGLFVQNDYKIHPRVTLNLGLRWELFGAPSERDGLQGTIDRAELANPATTVSDFRIQRQPQWYSNDLNNLAPRFGFAWDVAGNGRMAVRGGYGVFYDRIIGATASFVDGNTPGFAQAVQTFTNTDFPLDTRVAENPALPRQPGAPVLLQPVNRQTSIVVFQPGLSTGYVQHFNLNVQRELMRNTVIDIGWVRTKGVKLFTWLDINQPRIQGDFLQAFRELEAFRATGAAPPAGNTLVRLFGTPQAAVTALGATTLQQGLVGAAADTVDRSNFSRYAAAGVSDFYLRNFPQFNQLIRGSNDGLSWYDSLQVGLRRQTGNLKFGLNYTWSKTLDNLSVDGNGFTAPIDNVNLRLNRARGDFDRPHVLNYNLLWSLPFGRGKRWGADISRLADTVFGGWEWGLLGIWQSGSPFTVSSGRRTSASTANTWADYSGDRTIGRVDRRGNGVFYWTNEEIGRFSFPGAGEIGTSGRNSFRGPRFFNMDISIVKRFPLFRENHAVQFRAEMYNLWNNANFANPGANIATPQALGRINATLGDARIMQMALRYEF